MNTKLTLRMDEALIASAKSYAAAHGSSVSHMVANYFAALGHFSADTAKVVKAAPTQTDDAPDGWQDDLGPLTRSLVGILKAKPGQPQVTEGDYYAYLERKYLGDEAMQQTDSPT
jgi:hypothetical protein